jgi:hypothetical protein
VITFHLWAIVVTVGALIGLAFYAGQPFDEGFGDYRGK